MKRGSWAPAVLALVACAVCYLAGWQGTDWAAEAYRATQASRYGVALWDPGWYGGTLPLNYSLLYPLLSGWLGLWPVAALSAAAASYCWDRLITSQFGRRRAASWYFAAATVIEVAIGQLPTLAGEALALATVLALLGAGGARPAQPARPRARPVLRLATSLGLAVATGLTSPVVGVFLALSLAAWSVARARALPGLVAVVALVATAVLPLVFPGPGYFPFLGSDVVVIVGLCALLGGPLLPVPPSVRLAAALYGMLSVGLFFVRTQLGDNDARFAAYIGVPLALCYLAGPTRLPLPRPAWALTAALIAAGLVVWEWQPMAEAVMAQAHGPSATAAFYRPLTRELTELSRGKPVRVEVPPTLHHWESDYVALKFPLARGWERQLDMAYDQIFYRPGALTAGRYRSWLLASGVSFVALADAPLDYAATAEAELLTRGRVPGLSLVWHNRQWRLWRVEGTTGLASGPAQVTGMTPLGVTVRFSRPGASELKVRWSGYWTLPPKEAGDSCLSEAPGGWTELDSSKEGVLKLTMSPLTRGHGRCSVAKGLRSNVHSR